MQKPIYRPEPQRIPEIWAPGSRADILPSSLTAGSSTTDGTSFATASVTPAANVLHLLAVTSTHGTAAESPSSVTGNGLTWNPVTNGAGSIGNGTRRTSWLYAYGAAPSAGAITINFAGTMTTCIWSVVALPGAALADAVQGTIANANGTTVTGTLAALSHANNIHIYAQSHTAAEASAPPAAGGWQELSDTTVATPSGTMQVAWALGDTTADPTWTTSTGAVIVSLEIAAA